MGCSHTIIPASEGHLFACPGSRIGSRVRWIRDKNPQYEATIQVSDGAGSVGGATVNGRWLVAGVVVNAGSGTTSGDGFVTINSGRLKGSAATFCVADVIHAKLSHDAAQNLGAWDCDDGGTPPIAGAHRPSSGETLTRGLKSHRRSADDRLGTLRSASPGEGTGCARAVRHSRPHGESEPVARRDAQARPSLRRVRAPAYR